MIASQLTEELKKSAENFVEKNDQVFDLMTNTDLHLNNKMKLQTSKPPHLRPTEAAVIDIEGRFHGTCMRQSYDRLLGLSPDPTNAYFEKVFMLGTAIEESFGKIWNELGITYASKVPFYDRKYNISGELDRIHKDPTNQELYGIEIKSAYGVATRNDIMGTAKKVGTPHMHHLLQSIIYLYELKDTLSRFELVYLFRDNPNNSVVFRIYLVQLSDKKYYPIVFKKSANAWSYISEFLPKFSVEDILQQYVILLKHLKEQTMPPKYYKIQYTDEEIRQKLQTGEISQSKLNRYKNHKLKYLGDWQCDYCRRKDKCWN